MDNNKNIEFENSKQILDRIMNPEKYPNEITLIENKTSKCSKCNVKKNQTEFNRKGKTFKTCNNCENTRLEKNKKGKTNSEEKKETGFLDTMKNAFEKNIVTTDNTKTPELTKPIDNTLITSTMITNNVLESKISDVKPIDNTKNINNIVENKNLDIKPVDNTVTDDKLKTLLETKENNTNIIKPDINKADMILDKLLCDNLVELKKINEMESFLHIPLTSQKDYDAKTLSEKNSYQKNVIELFTKKLQSTNPLVYMLLISAGIFEKNTHYLQYAGIDLNLEGFQKELDTHRKELNECCNDIVLDAPQIVKVLNNPFLKLGIILTHSAHECHKKNTEKTQNGSPK